MNAVSGVDSDRDACSTTINTRTMQTGQQLMPLRRAEHNCSMVAVVSGKTDLARRDLDKVLEKEPKHLKVPGLWHLLVPEAVRRSRR
eukprot:SAG31_NODE_106_length_24954_cov_17.726413_7_plen_87_part_00